MQAQTQAHVRGIQATAPTGLEVRSSAVSTEGVGLCAASAAWRSARVAHELG